ncbi:MAG: divalent-cation tolerance protein CutA [Candidatus Brocadiae bacterium]|nr:divalent-cation tolerance protein CutA [Candidatus Brocadiia bacterium]
MRVVLCNCPENKAKDIAKTLVAEKIAACVNIIPGVQSFYYWQGKLCEEKEDTLLIKISKENISYLYDRLKAVHPYEVPEIVELNVADANQPYIQWLYQTKHHEVPSD